MQLKTSTISNLKRLVIALVLFNVPVLLTANSITDRLALFNSSPANNPELADQAPQQTMQVSGTVNSMADNFGIPGANVIVKGTQEGTITNAEGNYNIEVPSSDATLIFSYVGFESKEVPVNGRTTINVELAESLESLEEVVVTALGIERDKRSLGYSVDEVQGKEITMVPQENVLNGLQGRVTGVQINQTGGVGSSIMMTIRGATSLTTDNQPLFVIDGQPVNNSLNNVQQMGSRNQVDYGNPIADLNPQDIESVSVLKGPSAAALYGTRAGNGVVIITTKKGKRGSGLGVSFTTSNVFEEPMRLLDFHYQHANGQRGSVLDEGSAYWAGPKLDVGNTAVQWNSPTGPDGNPQATPLVSYPDNMYEFLQTSITSDNNLALSGGTENAAYRISYNHMSHRGLIPNSDLFRNSINASLDFDLSDKVKVSTNLNYIKSNSNDRPATGNRGANALQAVYTWSHVDVNDLKDYWVPGQEQIEQLRPSDEHNNPWFLAHELTNAFQRDRIFGNLKLDYQINDEFSIFGRVAYDGYNEFRESRVPWSYHRERRGGLFITDINRHETNSDFLATYNKSLSDFNIQASVGGNYMKQNYQSIFNGSRRNAGLVIPGLYTLSNIPQDGLQVSNDKWERAIYSLYATASFGYKEQLYLDVSARNDWSSTLPPENRSFFYPSASLSWLANYTFDLPSEISLLKFRAGWAQAGNDASPYQLEQMLGTGNWGGLVTAGLPSRLLNPTLKPEISTSSEVGIDVNLFNNRLRFEGTYFYMENENQILPIRIPQSSGFSSIDINAGLLASRGWEISLGGTPISTSTGFSLDINANFTNIRTTVEELTEGFDFVQIWGGSRDGAWTYVGEEIGNLYSAGFAQVEDPSSPYYGYPILGNTGYYQRLNDRENARLVGNFNPDFILGFQTTVNWKRFSLNANFDWRQGGEFTSYTYRYGESDWKSARQKEMLVPGGLYSEQELVDLLKSDPSKVIPSQGNYPRVGGYTEEEGGFFIDEGGVQANDGGFIPGVIQTAGGDTPDDFSDDEYQEHLGGPGTVFRPVTSLYPWSYHEHITFDASFLKLREISISYRVPQIGPFSNATFSLFSRNLVLWTAADIGIDPERAFEANSGAQGNTSTFFRQGLERQNVVPWTMPVGFKIGFNL